MLPIWLKQEPRVDCRTISAIKMETSSSPGEQAVAFSGLDYAKSLGFTQEQYDESVKRVKSPNDVNQLLVALLEVSSDQNNSDASKEVPQHCDVQRGEFLMSSTSTSGCSGTASWASSASAGSSSNHSLNSLASHQMDAQASQPHSDDLHSLNCDSNGLRRVYVDGSNVARTHGKNNHFSWLGIKICVDWFQRAGHKVKVLVPEDKCRPGPLSQMETGVLEYLRHIDVLIETPMGCNDDMFIIEAARQMGGIIVSNDLYRDERRRYGSSENLDQFIYLNRLPYVFDDDLFIPASDPRGRSGPRLAEFLRFQPHQQHQQQEYGLHLHRMRPQGSRSLPAEKIIKRPLLLEEATNQPPVERLIPISRTNQRQHANGAGGTHSMAHPGRDRPPPARQSQQQHSVPRLQLGRAKSHNY